MYDPYAEFETHVMPNGLTVHVSEWKDRPWQYVGFVVHAGHRQNLKGRDGIAHFVEHLFSEHMLENTEDEDPDFFFTMNGGFAMLGGTKYDSTLYSFGLPAKKKTLAKGLELFSKGMFPKSLHQGIEKQRAIIKAEHLHLFPQDLLFEKGLMFLPIIFKGHPLEHYRGGEGDLATIESLTIEELQEYHDRYYVPANIEIIAIGGLPTAEMLGLVRNSSLMISKNGSKVLLPNPITQTSKPCETLRIFHDPRSNNVEKDSCEYQSILVIPGSFSKYSVLAAKSILGSQFSKVLREQKQFVYDVDLRVHSYPDIHGMQLIMTFRNEQGIINLIDDHVTSIAKLNDTHERMFKNWQYRTNKYFNMRDFSGRGIFEGVMQYISEDGRISIFADNDNEFNKVTFQDIIEISKYWERDRRFTLALVP